MTDRLNGFTVMLEKPMREDDAKFIKNAILAIRGVLAVTPQVHNFEEAVAEQRVRRELLEKVYNLIKEGL